MRATGGRREVGITAVGGQEMQERHCRMLLLGLLLGLQQRLALLLRLELELLMWLLLLLLLHAMLQAWGSDPCQLWH